MVRRFAGFALCLLLGLTLSPEIEAQQFGVGFGAGYNIFGGDDYEDVDGGLQIEGLARVAFDGGFQIGAGVMRGTYSVPDFDETVAHLEVFGEPRFVFNTTSSIAPFLGGRVAWTRESAEVLDFDLSASGFTISGLAGIGIKASDSVMIEFSGLFGFINLGDAEIDGVTVPDSDSSGTILGFRAGLSLTVPRG